MSALQKEESEVISEEVEYVQALRATCQVFIKPLRAKKGQWGFSGSKVKKLDTLFTHFENIANMHGIFVLELQKPGADILGTFKKYVDVMKIYTAYHKDFDEQYAIITETLKKKEFKEFVAKKKEECGVDVAQAFFNVVLRISQYEISLRRLYTISKNPAAKETADKFQKFAKSLVETRKGVVDHSTEGILEVHEKIRHSPFKHLLQPHRKFQREERFNTPDEGEKWFALFNDLIIWTDEEYMYLGHFSLKDTKLVHIKEKAEDGSFCFRLESPSSEGAKQLLIYNPSRQVLDEWAEEVEKSIKWSTQHKSKIRRDSVVSPEEKAKIAQLKAKKQPKELTTKKGESETSLSTQFRSEPAPLVKISRSNLVLSKYCPRIVLERILEQDRVMADLIPNESTTLLPNDAEWTILNHASVLVADVSGFTKLNERLRKSLGEGGAEEVTGHLNKYFTSLLSIIGKHGGDCVKFAGDALIILFSREALLLRQQEIERERERKRKLGYLVTPNSATATSSTSTVLSTTTSLPPSSPTSGTATTSMWSIGTWSVGTKSGSTIPKSQSDGLSGSGTGKRSKEEEETYKEIQRRSEEGLEHDRLVADGLDPAVPWKARDTLRATQCALELQQKAGMHEAGDVKLQLHIAVASGTVYAWHVGGFQGEWEFLIVGDPFSQLARGVDLSKTGDVVVSKKAWSLISKFCKGETLPKCKTGEVKVEAVTHPLVPHAIPSLPEKVYNNKLIKEAQRAYLSRCVLDKIDAGQQDWLAELRQASVVFVNLTGLVLNKDLRKLEQEAKEVHWICQAMQAVVSRNQGYRRQFLVDDKGTVLIVVFGVPPYAHEDDPFRAVKTALELREALVDENVAHGIGIASGDVYVGSVGSTKRQEHAVVGDTVNLSARLSGKAAKEEYGIIMDQATYEKVKNSIRSKPIGEMKVKGKDEVIKVYSPDSFDINKALSKEATDSLSGTISRQEETEKILSALHAMRSDGESIGQGQVFLVEGEAGIGKTQLLRNFFRVAQSNVASYYVAAIPTEQTSLLSIWRDLIEQMAGITKISENDVSSTGVRKSKKHKRDIRRRTKAVLAFMKTISQGKQDKRVPLLNLLLMTQIENNEWTKKIEEGADDQSETTLKHYAKTLIYYIIESVIQKKKSQPPKPLCLLIEGVDLIDADSLDVLCDISALTTIQPLLLIISARPISKIMKGSNHPWVEGRQKIAKLPKCTKMLLKGLEIKDVERLISQSLFIKAPLPDDLLKLIYTRSNGNPLYALEVAVHLRDTGLMEIKDGNCTVDMEKLKSSTDIVPSSLSKLMIKKIDNLPILESLVCKMASIFEEEFDVVFLRMLFHKELSRQQREGDDSLTQPPPTPATPYPPTKSPSYSNLSFAPPQTPVARIGSSIYRRRLDDDFDNTLHALVKKGMFAQRIESDRRRTALNDRKETGARRVMYSFVLAAFRRACYKLLLYSQRTRLHLEVAEILELHNKDDVRNEDMMAWHYTQALKSSHGRAGAVPTKLAKAEHGTVTKDTGPSKPPPPRPLSVHTTGEGKTEEDVKMSKALSMAERRIQDQQIVKRFKFMIQQRLEEEKHAREMDVKGRTQSTGGSGPNSRTGSRQNSPSRPGSRRGSKEKMSGHARSPAAVFSIAEQDTTFIIDIEGGHTGRRNSNSMADLDDSNRSRGSGDEEETKETKEKPSEQKTKEKPAPPPPARKPPPPSSIPAYEKRAAPFPLRPTSASMTSNLGGSLQSTLKSTSRSPSPSPAPSPAPSTSHSPTSPTPISSPSSSTSTSPTPLKPITSSSSMGTLHSASAGPPKGHIKNYSLSLSRSQGSGSSGGSPSHSVIEDVEEEDELSSLSVFGGARNLSPITTTPTTASAQRDKKAEDSQKGAGFFNAPRSASATSLSSMPQPLKIPAVYASGTPRSSPGTEPKSPLEKDLVRSLSPGPTHAFQPKPEIAGTPTAAGKPFGARIITRPAAISAYTATSSPSLSTQSPSHAPSSPTLTPPAATRSRASGSIPTNIVAQRKEQWTRLSPSGSGRSVASSVVTSPKPTS